MWLFVPLAVFILTFFLSNPALMAFAGCKNSKNKSSGYRNSVPLQATTYGYSMHIRSPNMEVLRLNLSKYIQKSCNLWFL